MNVYEKIREYLGEELDEASLAQYKAVDAAGKIMGLDVGKKGSIRDILAKANAIKSVSDSMKLINKMAEIIAKEME